MKQRLCPTASPCLIAIALLISHGLLLLPSSSPFRIAAVFTLLALPGLAWSELLFSSTTGPLRWTIGIGLSYALVLNLGTILHYLPGPILPWHVLLVVDALVVTSLVLQLLAGVPSVSAVPGDSWGSPIWFALLCCLALAAFFRLFNLSYSEFQGDEVNAVLPAARALEGFGDALFTRKKGPGEILLPTLVWALSGTINETIARIPFAAAGVLAILTTFQLGRRFGDIQAALAAAALVALNGLLVAFSRIVQYQVLVVLMTSLTLLSALQWRLTWQIRWAVVTGFFLAAGFLSHYDAVVLLPPLAYVVFVAWKDGGTDGVSLPRIQLVISLLAGLVVLLLLMGLFYIPFWLSPQTEETISYLSDRIGEGLIKNSLASFIHYNIFYSSFYYLVVTGLLVLGFLMAVLRQLPVLSRLPGWRFWMPILTLLVGLAVMIQPEGLAIGNLDLVPLIFAVLLGGALLSPMLTVDQRTVLLWFAVAFWSYNFLLDRPVTHIYMIVVPWSLVAGFSAAWLWRWTRTRLGTRVPALALSLLLIIVFGGFLHQNYLRTDLEYWEDWPQSRSAFYWAPPPYDEPPPVGIFGFVHRAGWKAIGSLYASGVLRGDYLSNEKDVLTRWYIPGAVQADRQELSACGQGPELVFVAQDQINPDLTAMDPASLERQYEPVGRVTLPNGKGLTIHQRRPVTLNLGTFEEDSLALAFDRRATPETFTRTSLPSFPTAANFGNLIRLEGFDLKFAEDQLSVSLFWRAMTDVQEEYHVFVHLEGGIEELETSGIWGQSNGIPQCSLSPTDEWQAGQLFIDRSSFAVDPETPAGEYAVVVGLYRPENGMRLDVLDDEGRPLANYAKLTTVSIP